MLRTRRIQVVVVGAGAAGVTAAIASGRNGADTLLIESQGFLGGLSTALPWLGYHDQDYRSAIKGIPLEYVRRLQQAGAASEFVLDPKVSSVISIDGHFWKCLAMSMVREAGVRVMLHANVVDTLREGDRIAGVVVEHKSGREVVAADVVIDCSGDGDVAARGGVDWEKGRRTDGLVQAATLVFRLAGADRNEFIAACKDPRNVYREQVQKYPGAWDKLLDRLETMPVFLTGGFKVFVDRAREQGEYDIPQSRVNLVKLHRPDQYLIIMTKALGLDPSDVGSLSDAYGHVYEQIPQLIRFFRNWVPGFRNSYLLEIAPLLGIRESRRIMGDYVLTAEDVIRGTQFTDVVALGGYQIDIHHPSSTYIDTENVETYDVPFRCLRARGVDGLLMAGKCISATHEAIGSTRAIPICMAQGQAVGTAAALAVQNKVSPRDLNITGLQSVLIEQGAELRQTLGQPNQEMIELIGRVPKPVSP